MTRAVDSAERADRDEAILEGLADVEAGRTMDGEEMIARPLRQRA